MAGAKAGTHSVAMLFPPYHAWLLTFHTCHCLQRVLSGLLELQGGCKMVAITGVPLRNRKANALQASEKILLVTNFL